jgi:ketosteroid isomerase-like protein
MSDSQSNAVQDWMTGYRKAWESNHPDEIGALFTDDAVYYNEPFSEPARGRDAIIEMWQERQDAPGSTTFAWEPVVVTDDTAIIQGETDYGSVTFSNLWVIRLDAEGRATEFTEWWMDQSKPSSE